MPKSAKKVQNPIKKGRGRQSDFSGEKEEYLDGLAKNFANRKDRKTLYDEAAQGLIERFGYSHDGKVYVEGDSLTPEDKREYYQNLRSVSACVAIRISGSAYAEHFKKMGQWFRHRNLAKSSDRTYVAEIVNSIKSAASVQPTERSALGMYMEKNKDKISSDFTGQWSVEENTLTPKQCLPKYNKFAQACWKKETQTYRDEMKKEAQSEHKNAIRDWKGKIESFKGTPEEFERSFFRPKLKLKTNLTLKSLGDG
jgi:hypothetical protein